MEISAKQIALVFTKLQVQERHSTHHVAGFIPDADGNLLVPVYHSHGRKGLAGPAAHQFRKSLFLSVSEFNSLVECTLSRTDYLELISSVELEGPD